MEISAYFIKYYRNGVYFFKITFMGKLSCEECCSINKLQNQVRRLSTEVVNANNNFCVFEKVI